MKGYPFGAWEPDKAKRLNDGLLTVANGVYATADGYRPVGNWVQSQESLPSPCRGAGSFTSSLGTSIIVAGTSTTLYKANASGWVGIGTGYSIQGSARWRFAQFGGLAIATNGINPMVKIDLVTFAVAPLGGNPPKFDALAVVKDFLVGAILDGDTMTLGWSGRNNAEFWTFAQNQSDFNEQASGGKITGLIGGEVGIILQRDRISRMDYVGGNTIFEINELSSNIGCVSVNSVAQWGTLGFFLADEGFMMLRGTELVPIGQERVNREFQARYGVADISSMSTAVDPVESVVKFSMGDRTYVYNWVLDKWTTITCPTQIIFSGVTRSVELDEQDPNVGVNDDLIDSDGLLPFDDISFIGGMPRLYVINTDNAMGAMMGVPVVATLTGTAIEMVTGRDALLRFARPDCDALTGYTLTISTKRRLGDVGALTPYTSIHASGDMPLRERGRYIGYSLQIAGTWTEATGISFEYERGSAR